MRKRWEFSAQGFLRELGQVLTIAPMLEWDLPSDPYTLYFFPAAPHIHFAIFPTTEKCCTRFNRFLSQRNRTSDR
ncbi:hypothetical protein Agabi119p4_915 [Agaricus bisporus var. burnettii]|uniref:Uncharacterized protein n=1 Tax=Agaricus bisporus var. burnettii TaxID=192524 RepID=A0A8H7KL73_AGABI|nr:hypothetical protein Agabi119p4_915 [Agaricus bisporus var. burnettii]